MNKKLERLPDKKSYANFEVIQKFIDEENHQALDVLRKDRVGSKLLTSIESGLEKLSSEKQNKIKELINDFLVSLDRYHGSYINLKRAAGSRRFHFEDIEKLKKSIGHADERERILHNTFMDSLNILSRNMKELGLDNSWRGDEEIYGTSESTMRDRTRNWMLKLFKEII